MDVKLFESQHLFPTTSLQGENMVEDQSWETSLLPSPTPLQQIFVSSSPLVLVPTNPYDSPIPKDSKPTMPITELKIWKQGEMKQPQNSLFILGETS